VIRLDPESGELTAPASVIQGLLDGTEEPGDPALAAALAAARAPTSAVTTLGAAPYAEVRGDRDLCVLVTARAEGRRALLPLAAEQVPLALAVLLELGPRPVPAEPTVRLAPGAMAVLIGRRQAHGHGLDHEIATALQRRLEQGVRHWTVRFEAGGWRRNLEVLEGDGGIWRVRPAGELVELAPTTTTDVVRELVALCERARRGGRPAAP
jgi:hypothetical protein